MLAKKALAFKSISRSGLAASRLSLQFSSASSKGFAPSAPPAAPAESALLTQFDRLPGSMPSPRATSA